MRRLGVFGPLALFEVALGAAGSAAAGGVVVLMGAQSAWSEDPCHRVVAIERLGTFA